MTNTVLDKQSLPETILRIIDTDKVLLREVNGEIHISPLREGSGLLGIGANDNLTTEKLFAFSQEDKENERRQSGE